MKIAIRLLLLLVCLNYSTWGQVPVFVQSSAVNGNGGSGASFTSTLNGVTSGNTLVLKFFMCFNGSCNGANASTTVNSTSDADGTYILAPCGWNASADGQMLSVGMAYRTNASSGTHNVQITTSNGSNTFYLSSKIEEYSGTAASSIIDQCNTGVISTGSPSIASGNTTAANELYTVFVSTITGWPIAGTTGGCTQIELTGNGKFESDYLSAPTLGSSYTCGWGLSSSGTGTMMGVTFKGLGAASFGTTVTGISTVKGAATIK